MEASSPTLSIESFSYRWLISLKSSLESLDDYSLEAYSDETAAFIVMDPNMTPSKRFLGDTQLQDFNFPTTPSSHLTFVHAEDLFSNGFIMPLFLNPSKIDAMEEEEEEDTLNYSVPKSSVPITSKPSKIVISINQIHSIFAKRCWRSSKRIFKKYLGFLKPVYRKSQSLRLSSGTRGLVGTNWENSQQMSPSRYSSSTISYSIGDLCDAEGSIYEAVLHCKKSIEK